MLNNAIYGKTNENVLNRNNFELVKNTKLAIKKMSKENFKCGTMINDLYFIESQKQSVKYNRPNYIGNAILDLSKLYMFEFHHNYMKQKYGDKCELVYTDTDSFVYLVETDDLFQDCFDNRELFELNTKSIVVNWEVFRPPHLFPLPHRPQEYRVHGCERRHQWT